jgi:hypothetical protein
MKLDFNWTGNKPETTEITFNLGWAEINTESVKSALMSVQLNADVVL